MSELLGARYQILGPLGGGGFSEVVLARDRLAPSRPVALKRLRASPPPSRHLQRFWRECELLASCQHPGLIALLGIGQDQTTSLPFQVLEYIPGHTLDVLLAGADAATIELWVLEILDALAYLHARGVVHGDLKPDNILVWGFGRTARIKLIDLDLARPIGAPLDAIQGTLPFLAPEVAAGQASDARADLFSLGVILARELGAHDGSADQPGLHEPLPWRPMAEVNPAIPSRLASLIDWLTEPDPARRCPNAHAAIARLSPEEGFVEASHQRLTRGGRLVGVDGLLRRLRRELRAVARGRAGRALVLEGPAGAGKSSLLRLLAVEATRLGVRVIRLHPPTGASGHSVEHGALAALIEHALPGLSGGHARRAQALAEALAGGPCAVLVDDLQLMDADESALWEELCHCCARQPLVLLATTAQATQRRPWRALLRRQARLAWWSLPTMDAARVEELSAARLFDLAVPAEWPLAVTAAGAVCGGQVETLLARCIELGHARPAGQGWRPDATAGAWPAQLVDTARALERLDGPERQLLEAAAVLRLPSSGELLAGLAGVAPEPGARALQTLVARDLLAVVPGPAGQPYLAMPDAQQAGAIYARLGEPRRRELHQRAASLVAAPDPTRRDEHRLGGQDDADAVAAALGLAARARERGAHNLAIHYAARGFVRAGAYPALGCACALELARGFLALGEAERVVQWLALARGLLGAPPDPALRVELIRLEAERALAFEAHAVQRAARMQLVAELTALPDEARLALARLHAALGDEPAAEAELCALLARPGANPLRARLIVELGRLLRHPSRAGSAREQANALIERARAEDDRLGLAAALTLLGRAQLGSGQYRHAHQQFIVARRLSHALGSRPLEHQALHGQARALLAAGNPPRALALLREALDLAQHGLPRAAEAHTLADLGLASLTSGRLEAAHLSLQRALTLSPDCTAAVATHLTLFSLVGQHERARALAADHGGPLAPLLVAAMTAAPGALARLLTAAQGERWSAGLCIAVLAVLLGGALSGQAGDGESERPWLEWGRSLGVLSAQLVALIETWRALHAGRPADGATAMAPFADEEAPGPCPELAILRHHALGRLTDEPRRAGRHLLRAMQLTQEQYRAAPTWAQATYLETTPKRLLGQDFERLRLLLRDQPASRD